MLPLVKLKVVLVCWITVLLLIACSSSVDESKGVRIGSEGRLRGGSESTVAALDYETLKELARAQYANDKHGIREISLSGRILLIPNGTKVLVIGGDWGAYKVRILEGEHTSRAVWVDASSVIEPNATPATNQNHNTVVSATNQNSGTNEFGLSLDSRLFSAASLGNASEVVSLIKQGANVNTKAVDMRTPLFDAVREGHADVVRILLSEGADVNARHQSGVTPIMWAAMGKSKDSVEIVKILLAAGADVRAKDYDGDSVLKWAKKYKNKEIIRIIQEAEAAANGR